MRVPREQEAGESGADMAWENTKRSPPGRVLPSNRGRYDPGSASKTRREESSLRDRYNGTSDQTSAQGCLDFGRVYTCMYS